MWCELYDIERELGRGQFGVVVQAVEKATGDRVAIKVMGKKTFGKRDTCMHTADREVKALRIAHGHPPLLQLFDVLETATEAALILELIEGGELFDYLAKKDMFTEEEAVVFTRQLIDGLAYLHSRMVVHLDIKPENILLVEAGSVNSIKIIDFGLARVLNDEEPQFETHGTTEFVAPEIVRHKPVSTSTDMWAVGVTTYILLSGMSPFLGETDKQTFCNIVKAHYDIDEDFGETEVSSEAKDFIESLLVKDPRERLTAEGCLGHQWIRSNEMPRKRSLILTERLRKFNARRKWHSTVQAVQATSFMRRLSLKRKLRISSSSASVLPGIETEDSGGSCASSETDADDVLPSPVGACGEHVGPHCGVRRRSGNSATSPLLSQEYDVSRDQMQELADKLRESTHSLKLTGCPTATLCSPSPTWYFAMVPEDGSLQRLLLVSPDCGVDITPTMSPTWHNRAGRRHSTGNGRYHKYGRKPSDDWSCIEEQTADSHWWAHSTRSDEPVGSQVRSEIITEIYDTTQCYQEPVSRCARSGRPDKLRRVKSDSELVNPY